MSTLALERRHYERSFGITELDHKGAHRLRLYERMIDGTESDSFHLKLDNRKGSSQRSDRAFLRMGVLDD